MWPMRLEMNRDECKKCLRRLESDAYGSMVSVLRAQGPFTNDKQKLLQELAKVLHISNERHRSEVRRVVNDDMLATIAEQLNGPNTGTDWAIESRRTIPLIPRLKARSAFTTLANSLSLAITTVDEKKLNRHVIPRWHGNSTATEIESQCKVQTKESLSIHTKLRNLENDLDVNKILEENSNLAKNEKIDNKDVISKVLETPKVSRLPEKRKLSSLSTPPLNKVLKVSKTTPLEHNFWTVENEQALPQALPATMHHQNVALIPSIDEISTHKMQKYEEQKARNNTQEVYYRSGLKKIYLVADNTQKNQRSENSNSNPPCNKRSMASIIHEAIISGTPHRHTVAMYPDTTVSSGPGPPQIKHSSDTLICKKLPSEQIAIFNQSTTKTDATINSKKIVNIPHYSNAKLNTKTNVIVIQKTKGVTLSHAGKEILGKVIIGTKNLCVTSQHNANSVSVQPHHISLNNGDQTRTVLPTANCLQNTESIKTNEILGKVIIGAKNSCVTSQHNANSVSVQPHHISLNNGDQRKTVLPTANPKILSQIKTKDSPDVLNSEPKTVISSMNAYLPKEECNNVNMIDPKLFLKTVSDTVDTSTLEEKQHRNNKNVNESMKSQVVNPLDSSNPLESKKVLASTAMQDDVGNIRIEDSDENMDAFGATLDTTDINLENFQYLVDNDDNHALEESMRSMITINQMNDHDDS